MKTIYKYVLPIQEETSIMMPIGANILRVDGLDGGLWIWAQVDTEALLEPRKFRLFKTGAEMPDDIFGNYIYLGCGAIFIQMELMLYVYEDLQRASEGHIENINTAPGVPPKLVFTTKGTWD